MLRFGPLLTAATVLLFAASTIAQPESPLESPPEPAEVSTPTPEATAPRGSAASWSAQLPTVSAGRHLWLWADHVDPKDDEVRLTALFHADATHRPPEGPVWEPVTEFRGRLAPHGVAPDGDALWLIYDHGKVTLLSLQPGRIDDQWYFRQTTRKALPPSTTVRASVAAHGKLWVLARVETGRALADLDQAETEAASPAVVADEDAEVMNLLLGLPRELPLDADDPLADPDPGSDPDPGRDLVSGATPDEGPSADEAEPASDDEDASAATAEVADEAEFVDSLADGVDAAADAEIDEALESAEDLPAAPADRLLVLDRGDWRVLPLPDGWDSNRPVQLIAPREGQAAPTLLVQGAKTKAGLDVTLYAAPAQASADASQSSENNAGVESDVAPAWARATTSLPAAGGVVGLRVKEQLLLAQHDPAGSGFTAQVHAVRSERFVPIGRATLDDGHGVPAYGLWTALPFGDAVGLLVGPREVASAVLALREENPDDVPPPGPILTAIDLHGKTTFDPLPLDVEPDNPLAESADTIILLAVVVSSTLLLFSFWRRDPRAHDLVLPEGWAVADLMRRGVAGAIDLLPGLWVATSGFGLAWEELYDRWPGRGLGATWEMMLPGLAAIGVVVGHTLILETATGRSIGKWATGLRVVSITGESPAVWQTIVRCLLKTFDLVAYLLLILPVISPHRQRLGDMVARTVVVAKSSAPVDEDDNESRGAGNG